MRRRIAGASAWLVLSVGAALAQMPGQLPSQLPEGPKVICRPCGEVSPPPGYSCAAGVMIAARVATADAAAVAATCGLAGKQTPLEQPGPAGSVVVDGPPKKVAETTGVAASSPSNAPATTAVASSRRRRKRRCAVGSAHCATKVAPKPKARPAAAPVMVPPG